MPKITIIVPVYNVEIYLPHCIDSILAQTFTDWELLLVDDGSPDRSGEICDEYAKTDKRIRVFHKKNGGVSSARNLGLDNAHGRWVTFIDADDYILPDFIKGLYKPIEAGEPVDFVHGGCCNVENGQIVGVNQSYENCIGEDPGYVFKKFRGLTVSKLFSLENVNRGGDGLPLRFDEKMKIAEDMAFTIDYLMSVKRYAFVEEKGYCYRVDNMSSATKKHKVEYDIRRYEFYHIYKSICAYVSYKELSQLDFIQREKQLGLLLFNTILDLYRVNLSRQKRLKHLKEDYTKEQFVLLKFVQTNIVKQVLACLLRKKHFLLFDFVANLAVKV